jgi:asparagine synthase (glutamine-hydrolysing)
MSGIAAIIRFDGAPIECDQIKKITTAMSYRGPDGINHWVNGSVALGQCMLRTTPESLEETQPLCNEDQSLVLVMDGRLDNWVELRSELQSHGTRLSSHADAELVLKAYETWGKECLLHIDGDFAFLIWDQRRREAFCARDRVGSKPFHYHWDGRRLIVSSDLHPIFAAPSVAQTPNKGMIAEILSNEWYSRAETMWCGVMRLVAAHYMSADGNGIRIEQYWSPPLEVTIHYKRDEEYFEHYREVFADCVRRASRSHRPLACEVSGGLDSSAVFCMAERLRQAGRLPAPALKGYTWIFDAKTDADEVEYARAVGAHLGLEIEEIEPFKPELSWFECRMREERDLPTYPNSAMAVSLRKAMARNGSRAVLNGEGGDEWLGGRRLYYAEQLAGRQWGQLYKSLREDIGAVGLRQTIAWLTRHGLVHFLPRPIKEAGRRLVVPAGPNNFDSAFWLSPEMQATFNERRAKFDRNHYLNVQDFARRAMFMVLTSAFGVHTQELIDRRDARLGLELRTPMYARRFIEFAFATPERIRLRGDTKKFIHIKAMEKLLPALLLRRRTKADFSIAFRWQLDKLRYDLLTQIPMDLGDMLRVEGIAKLYQAYSVGPVEEAPIWELWAIYACHRILRPAWRSGRV